MLLRAFQASRPRACVSFGMLSLLVTHTHTQPAIRRSRFGVFLRNAFRVVYDWLTMCYFALACSQTHKHRRKKRAKRWKFRVPGILAIPSHRILSSNIFFVCFFFMDFCWPAALFSGWISRNYAFLPSPKPRKTEIGVYANAGYAIKMLANKPETEKRKINK